MLGLVLRVWFALTDHGIVHADEIYQSLEPAHRAVFGYGFTSWEFLAGARNWTFAGLLAGLFSALSVLGIDSPTEYVAVTRVIFCLIGAITATGVYLLARAVGAGPLAAACAAAIFGLSGVFIFFAPRALSEVASAAPLVFGLALSLRQGVRQRELLLGGSLLGLAVLIRLQSALFCLGLLVLFVVRGQRRAAGTMLGVLLLWALLYGLVDKLTWGQWFRSAIVYLRFNIVDTGGGALFGTHEPWFYPLVVFTSMGIMALLLAVLAVLGARRALGLFAIVTFSIVAYSLVPHKELRFLLPTLVLLCAVAGAGIQEILDRQWLRLARLAPGAVVVAALVSAATMPGLTLADLGYYEPHEGRVSALDFHGPENRLLMAAYAQPDLCGLQVQTALLRRTGGFSYLHRPVLLYGPGEPNPSHFNYAIAPAGTLEGEEVAFDAGLALVRLPRMHCDEDSTYLWTLHD